MQEQLTCPICECDFGSFDVYVTSNRFQVITTLQCKNCQAYIKQDSDYKWIIDGAFN